MKPPSTQIDLAPEALGFAESLVSAGLFPSVSEYIEELVSRDRAAKAKLRDLIVAGIESGFGCVWTPELGKEMLAEAKVRRARVA